MQRNLILLAAVVAVCGAVASLADGATTAKQEMAGVNYLIGTWNCTHTVGTFSGTYTTSYAKVLGGLWLKQTYDFPPRQMGENAEAVQAEYLMGYDERRQGWVRFGGMSNGQYFAIRMTPTGEGGWSWKYISFFKRQTPETPDSDAMLLKKSASEYAVEGPSYEENGKPVTEHHVCKKL
jgi:hypothetical protein